MKIRTVKIHWEFMSFLRITENDVFRIGGARSFLDQNFPVHHIIYYKYYITGSLRSYRATSFYRYQFPPAGLILPPPCYPTLIVRPPSTSSLGIPVELDGNS